MTLRTFRNAGLAVLAAGLLAGCYYPAPPPATYAANPACAPGVNPDGTAAPAPPECYAYPSYAYPYYPYYPYYYYPPYYYPPVAVGVGVGFGFGGRFHGRFR
jgi:hypothetical protein